MGHDYFYDDCCDAYDYLPSIACYSYWIRSLHNKLDFLFTITSNNIFHVVMSDCSFNIAQTLLSVTCLDADTVWIITDYLPKYLMFHHDDNRCNAHLIYKYDPRRSFYDEMHDINDESDEYGDFLLNESCNAL